MDKSLALDKLRNICSRQEKSPADVVSFLKKWNVNADLHDGIIITLKSEKFIDERRYASAYVRDKMKFDRWGFIKIRIFLKQKGIAASIIDDAISSCDLGEYKAMIGHEIAKKRKTLKGEPYEKWAKLARYGAARGYEMEYMEPFLSEKGEI